MTYIVAFLIIFAPGDLGGCLAAPLTERFWRKDVTF